VIDDLAATPGWDLSDPEVFGKLLASFLRHCDDTSTAFALGMDLIDLARARFAVREIFRKHAIPLVDLPELALIRRRARGRWGRGGGRRTVVGASAVRSEGNKVQEDPYGSEHGVPMSADGLREDPLRSNAGAGSEAGIQRGEVVACIPRSAKREQLRVIHDSWSGHQFANLRIWFRDPEDRTEYLPTCRGVTIRRNELPQVLAALHEIARRLGVEAEGPLPQARGPTPTATHDELGSHRSA
jgi:hypothetical protein